MPVLSDFFVFKEIGAIKLELSILWREHQKNSPVLLYFHGNGSPFQGSRWDVPQHMHKGVKKWKYALISADFRLAPQVGIKDIFRDVKDCIKFIRDPLGLAAKLPTDTIDPKRLAVSGIGGGGYLALLAGLYVVPKPLAVLAISPISDPLGSFFTHSQPWDDPDEVKGEDDMDANTAESLLQPCLDPDGKVIAYHMNDGVEEEDPHRHMLYKYVLHRGNLAELLRLDVTANAQLNPKNDKWRVAKQIPRRRMPPTFIMHGKADDQVDVGQSDEVMEALKLSFGDNFTDFAQYIKPGGFEPEFHDIEGDGEDDSEEDSGDDGEVDSDDLESDLDWEHWKEELYKDEEAYKKNRKDDSEQEGDGDQQETVHPQTRRTDVM